MIREEFLARKNRIATKQNGYQLNVINIKRICLQNNVDLPILKANTYGLLTMAKVAGPPGYVARNGQVRNGEYNLVA